MVTLMLEAHSALATVVTYWWWSFISIGTDVSYIWRCSVWCFYNLVRKGVPCVHHLHSEGICPGISLKL